MCIPDGSPPDLIFYYSVDLSFATLDTIPLGTNLLQSIYGPISATMDMASIIGEYCTTATIYNYTAPVGTLIHKSGTLVLFLPQGTISYINNDQAIKNSQGSFVSVPGTVLVFPIVAGTGNFLNTKGFIAIIIDNTFLRTVQIYFDKEENPCIH